MPAKLKYKDLENKIGVYSLSHLINPRLMRYEDFMLPKDSAVFWMLSELPSTRHPFLDMENRPKAIVINEYLQTNPLGKFKKLPITLNTLVSSRRKAAPKIEFMLDRRKLAITPSTKTVICDFTALNERYSYYTYKGWEYDKAYNEFSCMVLGTTEPTLLTDRHDFIPMEIPKELPNVVTIKRLLGKTGKEFLRYAPPEWVPFIELFKWLDEKYEKDSIFSKVHIPLQNDVSIAFIRNSKITFVNLAALHAAKKWTDTNYRNVSKVSGEKLIRLILNYLALIVTKTEIVTPDDSVNLIEKDVTEEHVDEAIKNVDLNVMIASSGEDTDDVDEDVDVNIDVPELEELLTETYDPESSLSAILQDKVDLGIIKGTKALAMQAAAVEASDFLDVLNEEVTIDDLKITPDEAPDDIAILDKDMLKNTTDALQRDYIAKRLDKDIQKAFASFVGGGFPVTKFEELEVKDISNETKIYTIEVMQPSGTRATVKLRVPIIRPDGTFKLNNNIYTMRKQQGDAPIRKISPTEVALTSFYGKLFIRKGVYSRNNIGVSIYKALNEKAKNGDIKLLVKQALKITGVKLADEYLWVSRNVNSFVQHGVLFRFDYHNRKNLLKKGMNLAEIEKHGVLTGIKGTHVYVTTQEGSVLEISTKDYTVKTDHGNLLRYIGIEPSDLAVEPAVIRLMGKNMPLVLMLVFKFGWKGLLKLTKVKYRTAKSTRELKLQGNEYRVVFADKVYAFDKMDTKNTLIFGGLTTIEKSLKNFTESTLENKHGLIDILVESGFSNRYIVEFSNLYAMFVDPITATILKTMDEPSTLRGLLIRSIELLSTDFAYDPNDTVGVLFKGYERYAGMIYHILVKSMREYHHKQGKVRAKISVNPFDFYGMLSKDSTIMLKDDVNPVEDIKSREDVTMTGMFGRNKDAVTNTDRTVHPNDIGIISEATKDSSDVGITAYLSANPSIDNLYGKPLPKDNPSVAETYSPSALLAPFALTDDGKRTLYVSIQNKHVEPVMGQRVLPLLTGYELVMPYRVSAKYCINAKQKGEVTKVTKSYVEIKYVDGTTAKYKLYSWQSKDTGGTSYRHPVVTLLEKGDKVEVGDNITHAETFFGRYIFNPKRVAYKGGVLGLVAFTHEGVTYEDSTALSMQFAEKLKTKLTKVKSKVIPTNIMIEQLINIGNAVAYNTPMFVYKDGASSAGTDIKLKEASLELLKKLEYSAFKAETKGTITRIEIFYNADPEEMTPAVRDLISKIDKKMLDLYGYTGRVDNTYSVKGKPLLKDTMEIKVYIEKQAKMNDASKVIFANQLKATAGNIYREIVTSDGREVDARFGELSEEARIVNSPELQGIANAILVKGTDEMIKAYFGE